MQLTFTINLHLYTVSAMETAVILCYDAMKVVDFHIKIFYKEDLILRE
jgi:hypothetical protein